MIVGRAMIIACARTVAVCGTAGFGGVGLSASTERGVAVGDGLEMPGHPGVVAGFGSRAGGGFAGGCGGFEGGCGGFGVSTGLSLCFLFVVGASSTRSLVTESSGRGLGSGTRELGGFVVVELLVFLGRSQRVESLSGCFKV